MFNSEGIHLTKNRLPVTRERAHMYRRVPRSNGELERPLAVLKHKLMLSTKNNNLLLKL